MKHIILKNENSFSKKLPPFLKTMIAAQPMGFCSGSSAVLEYAHLPSVTTQVKSKWLIKFIRNNATMIENVFLLSDLV